jgi:hypothetical protein
MERSTSSGVKEDRGGDAMGGIIANDLYDTDECINRID